MRIQHNIMAMSAYRNYTNNVSAMKKNLEKLSSGYKINRAGDDAAGLAISEKMRAQITGLETAQKNAKDGISLVQTAEGALTEVHDMLNRMVELATQSANGTYDNTTDRKQMQKEVDQLLSEINRIADSSNFNGIKLLDGSLGLNQTAVSDIKYLDAEGQKVGQAIAVSATAVHGGDAGVFSKPELTVDLSDVSITNTGSATATKAVTLKIGGVILTADIQIADGSKATAGAIATAFRDKYTASKTATTGSNGANCSIKIGGAFYKLGGTGSTLKLELAGFAPASGTDVVDLATSGAKNTDKFTQSMATAFNDMFPGQGVSITVAASATKWSLDTGNKIIHGLTSIKKAESSVGADRWGADVTLTTGLMKDGAQLKIGTGTKASQTKTFTISISSTASKSTVQGSKVIISTKDAGSTATDQLKKFVQVMEGQNAGYFKISGKGADKLHIDVRASVAASKVKGWSTDTLLKAVSAKEKDTAAHYAGVTFTLDDTKLTKGDVIKVGNGTAAKSFIYQGSGANGFASAADLKTKLAAIYTGTNPAQVATEAGNPSGVKFTIYASTATGAAPMVQGRGLTLQIGDTSDPFNQLNVGVQDMHAVSLGISGLSIKNEVDAQKAIQKIKDAINVVSDVRGTLGATQNRLDHTINNLGVMTENIQDAESTIRDVDVAEEMMAYTKNNILIQSAQAMLAQANQVPQGVLQLLQ